MAEANSIQWRSVSTEGAAIIASILLALAIDAWWDYFGDRREEAKLLRNLEAELSDNLQNLTDGIEDVEVHT